MALNQIIHSTKPSVSELVFGLKEGTIFVDDTFQRRLVWTMKQKVRLVDTVLAGFPMPEIYLWLQPANEETGVQQKSVVDGQQRLTTMTQFTANEFPLSTKFLDEAQHKQPYAGLFWEEFSVELKRSFWEYSLNVRNIPAQISSSEISAIFTRLNETDKSLNPQELRNAAFNGEFIKASEEITNLDSFASINPFSISQIHRMKDIEFASSLLLFLRSGLVEESTKVINETYDAFNDEYPEAVGDIQVADEFFRRCKDMYLSDKETAAVFSKPVHLFTLFCSERFLLKNSVASDKIAERIKEFSAEYRSENQMTENTLLVEYRKGASSRTRSKANRQLRMNSLIRYVLG